MDRHRSIRMLDQCVVALPLLARLLLHLHFNLNVFIDSLNHRMLLCRIVGPDTLIVRRVIAA
jgi:hypothetical protein